MVRSLGRARAAALTGTTPEASRIPPARAARSRRPHGASARYSRSVASGSGGVPVLMRDRFLPEVRVQHLPLRAHSLPAYRAFPNQTAWAESDRPPARAATALARSAEHRSSELPGQSVEASGAR